MRGLFLFLASIVIAVPINAQLVSMSDGSVNICEGMFFDSGGKEHNYGSDEQFTLTIFPEKASLLTRLIFYEFDLNEDDYLAVFDGNSSRSPSLGVFNKENPVPKSIQASNRNQTGSLTFVFHSFSMSSARGWIADINCLERQSDELSNTPTASENVNEFIVFVSGIVDSNHANAIDEYINSAFGVYESNTDFLTGMIIVMTDNSIDLVKMQEIVLATKKVTDRILEIISTDLKKQ